MRKLLVAIPWGGAAVGALALAISGAPGPAMAVPCNPTCTVGGATFNTTDPGEGAGAVETDSADLTFLATFDPTNESPATITTAVDAFLANQGLPGGAYFGRTGGSGLGSGGTAPGDYSFSTTSANGGLSGTWTFNPGMTGDTAGYISLHAGGGQHDVLWEINAGFTTGGPFPWDTSENINGGGNSAAISNFDLFSGGPRLVPEPATLTLLGSALAGLGVVRRRRHASSD